MSVYGTQNPPPALFPFPPGNQFLVFNKEAVVTGEFSQQVALPTGPTAGQRGVRVEIDFNAAPGNCEFEVMESDWDQNGSAGYALVSTTADLTQTGLVAGPNGAGTRLVVDLTPFSGQFACLFVKGAPANSNITVTARISRAA